MVVRCKVCKKSAGYGINGVLSRCTTHKEENMKRIQFYICIENSCTTGATFNFKNETKRLYCAKHAQKGMVNLDKKYCCKDGCKSSRTYGYEGGKREYCAKHRLENMIYNHKKRVCKHSGCCTVPSYNNPNKKIGLFCKEHAEPGMKDVANKRCKHKGCDSNTPCFNYPGQKNGIYCAKHALTEMENVKSKKCKREGCKIQPRYNFVDTKIGIFCKEHAEEGMVDVVRRNCAGADCMRRPTYNYSGKTVPTFCRYHKEDIMVNVVSKTCAHNDCIRIALYNIQNTTPMWCSQHKTHDMINVMDQRCRTEGCDTFSSTKYDKYCVRCFIHLYPDNPRVKHRKIKESYMVDFIKQRFPGEDIINDKIVNNGCSRRRPDVYIDKFTHVVVIECDEAQHSDYETTCENKRTCELFQDFGNRPVVFVRFNPDAYTDATGKRVKSCFVYHKRLDVPCTPDKKEWYKRTNVLLQTVEKHLVEVPTKEITVEYLFYNSA
jgi:hypothetical protein